MAEGAGDTNPGRTRGKKHAKAPGQRVDLSKKYPIDPKIGSWPETVTTEGRSKATGLAHPWIANYHAVRAMVGFVVAMAWDKSRGNFRWKDTG